MQQEAPPCTTIRRGQKCLTAALLSEEGRSSRLSSNLFFFFFFGLSSVFYPTLSPLSFASISTNANSFACAQARAHHQPGIFHLLLKPWGCTITAYCSSCIINPVSFYITRICTQIKINYQWGWNQSFIIYFRPWLKAETLCRIHF